MEQLLDHALFWHRLNKQAHGAARTAFNGAKAIGRAAGSAAAVARDVVAGVREGIGTRRR